MIRGDNIIILPLNLLCLKFVWIDTRTQSLLNRNIINIPGILKVTKLRGITLALKSIVHGLKTKGRIKKGVYLPILPYLMSWIKQFTMFHPQNIGIH